MRLLHLAMAGFCGLALAACATQPAPEGAAPAPLEGPQMQPYPVQFSCPADGTVVATNIGVRRYFGADPVDAETCIMELPGSIGRQWRLYGLFTPSAENGEQLRAILREVFPLEAGKVVRRTVNQPESAFTLTFSVVGLSRVTVPAGTFTAWALDIRQEGSGFGTAFAGTRRVVLDQDSWVALQERYRIQRQARRAERTPDWQALRITAPAAP